MLPAKEEPRDSRGARLEAKLRRELGPILELLEKPDVTDVIVNGEGTIWVEDGPRGMVRLTQAIHPLQVENILSTVACLLDLVITPENPHVGGELPFFHARIQGTIPPASPRPQLAIRKLPARLYTLEGYIEDGIAESWQVDHIRAAVGRRHNVLVAGGTGSGKTTLLNALLHEAASSDPESQHFVILQDTLELSSPAPNTSYLRTCDALGLRALVRISLRMRPDRIIVGEVRGAEALDLLKAWNTGHPGGLATVHANSASSALHRLDQLVQEAGVPSQPQLIADGVDLIVCMARTPEGRRITELLHVDGYDPHKGYAVQPLRSPDDFEEAA